MPNNTETYWEADGTSLHTFAKSIETIGGMGPPKLRGENNIVPLFPGELWSPKTPGANLITLGMWVRGIAEHAANKDGSPTKAQYQSNYRDLVRLLYKPGQLIDLRKRFYDAGVLRIATAKAEYSGGLQMRMSGQTLGRCTVDLSLPHGFFYNDTELSQALVNGNNNITVLGDAPTTRVKVTIAGARTNAKIRNTTYGVEFTYARAVAGGQSAVVDVNEYTVDDTTVPTLDMAPSIANDGSAQWLYLQPGLNVINLSSSSGSGIVTLAYRAAWT